VTLVLLGLVIMLSSFIYTAVHLGASAIEEATLPYFDAHVQEDFTIETPAVINPVETEALSDVCSFTSTMLTDLYQEDKTCFYDVLSWRRDALVDLLDVSLETRLYKDAQITRDDETHRVRVIKDSTFINRTKLTAGALPQTDDEIAILENYARNNNLEIGDTLTVLNNNYTITGFVLFPDYNLPILDHVYMFSTESQTLALMTDDGFDALARVPGFHFSGLFLTSRFDAADLFEAHPEIGGLVQSFILTENNLRSGAIYDEISGSYATGLMLSVLISGIGIVIVGLMVKKTVESNKRPFGILKALGLRNKELMWPYLQFLCLFSLLFLLLGYGLGYLFSPSFRDLYLLFYLLPSEPIAFSLSGFLTAVFVPLLVLMVMGYFVIKNLLDVDALKLIRPPVDVPGGKVFLMGKSLFRRFGFIIRFQFTFLLRHLAKVAVYIVGVFFAIYLSFLAVGMLNVFEETVHGYYDTLDITSIGYGYEGSAEPDGEKVIELPALIDDTQAIVIGLSEDQILHPLHDRRGDDLLPLLREGLVVSRSFQLMSGVNPGDTVQVRLGIEQHTFEVMAVAAIYPGEHVFIDRAVLAQTIFADSDYYNAVYADTLLDEALYEEVFVVETLLDEVASMNEIVQTMFYLIVGTGLVIGLIIIYLLTLLMVEDHYYNIALFKVIGYRGKEIHKLILGGYQKLNVGIFLLVIPFALLTFNVMQWYFAQTYQFILPMRLQVSHVFLIAVLYGIIFMVASLHAKHKVNTVSLSAALKIYQV